MSSDRRNVSRWREWTLAGCTAWLVLQNAALFTLFTWARPAAVLAAGGRIARGALALSHGLVALGAHLAVPGLAVALGLGLAAWLVHVPADRLETPGAQEVHRVR